MTPAQIDIFATLCVRFPLLPSGALDIERIKAFAFELDLDPSPAIARIEKWLRVPRAETYGVNPGPFGVNALAHRHKVDMQWRSDRYALWRFYGEIVEGKRGTVQAQCARARLQRFSPRAFAAWENGRPTRVPAGVITLRPGQSVTIVAVDRV